MSDKSSDAAMSVHVHGPDVTLATALEVGNAMTDVLHEVAKTLVPDADLRWRIRDVQFCCDGCGHRQPLDADRVGWTHRDSNDYCRACSG